ncbi:MAG: hypothetical protein KGD64_11795 [Candidatus Heimdallarchaeota archaeon]|nr:hypothetical protein [Candidatus Heimdallarchaeota archaeon]
MSTKETTTPLERSMKKMDVLMRSFGMRTRIFKGKTRAVVKGTRKVYPYELNATIVETARGVGIRVQLDRIWYTFLKLIPFSIILVFSLLQYFVPSAGQAIADATGVDLFLLILGPNPKPIGLWVVLPIISIVIVGSEILERIIRAKYIQNRMPRFLSGAEWMVAEPPVALDIVSSSNNLIWLMYVILIIIFAPLSFHEEIYAKFLEVYQVESAALRNTTMLISVLDIAIVSGIMFAILYQNYEKFRGSLDRQQMRHDIKIEGQTRQMFQVVLGVIFLATLELSLFYFTFWSSITVVQVLMFYGITIISSVIGCWLFWQKENYNFIAMAIWFFLIDVVMIFMNANDASYSWMIICHLFLILLIAVLSINRYFEQYLEKKGMFEPSWIFNPLPIFSFITVFLKKKARGTKGVDKELDEILDEEMKDKVKEKEPLFIDIDKVRIKGKEAVKIIEYYEKLSSRVVKGELNILSLTALDNQIKEIVQSDKTLRKEAGIFFSTVDSLLWHDDYKLEDGEKVLKIGEKLYHEIIKTR